MANPMQNKWVCNECYTREPDLMSWGPLQLKEFREMQAAFTLPCTAHAADYDSRYKVG